MNVKNVKGGRREGRGGTNTSGLTHLHTSCSLHVKQKGDKTKPCIIFIYWLTTLNGLFLHQWMT